jgi:hypothetical protein
MRDRSYCVNEKPQRESQAAVNAAKGGGAAIGGEQSRKAPIAVNIFVVEINGTAVVAFNADSLPCAERIAADPRMRSDLMVNETAAGPILERRRSDNRS